MTCADLLIRLLRDTHDVDTLFGIPGVHTIELYRGLEGGNGHDHQGRGIRHVTPRHEQGAGFMADGYARATGRPGVAFVITGPGLLNILTPLGQSDCVRVSLCHYNSVAEVGAFLSAVAGLVSA